MLADLQLGEFIYEQPPSGDVEYTFKHALTQEVTYNSILSERRKALHERAGKAMEALFATSLADHYDDLAHHYRRSGNGAKAIDYLRLAAEQAMNRSAYGGAAAQLTAALELLGTRPGGLERDRTEIALRFKLAVCVTFSVIGAFASAATSESLERARELCAKVGDDASLMGVLAALAFVYASRPERQKADAVCKELLEVATRAGDAEMVGRARIWLGFSPFWAGSFSEAVEQFERAYKLPAGTSSRWEVTFGNWRTISRSVGALAWWMSGYPERAIAISRESLDVAREKGEYAPDLAPALFWSASLNFLLRDAKSAGVQTAESLRLAHEHGLAALLSPQGFYHGWALAHLGHVEEGLSEMARCWSELAAARESVLGHWLSFGLCDIYLATERAREGLEAVGEGIQLSERTGTRVVEAELRRLKGELLLRNDSGAMAEAAECFREAIDVARRQSAKSWELRATMSLARLLAKESRRDEAHTMLAEIYGWFTEGFDTADLKDARALLDELSE